MKLPDTWESIPPIVEKIIAARTFKRTVNHYSGGKVIAQMEAERPMRFRDFCAEIGMEYQLLYRIIRLGTPADEGDQDTVRAWCKKHQKHAKL